MNKSEITPLEERLEWVDAEKIETTSDRTGYPRFLENAWIGISWEYALKMKEDFGVSIEIFKKKDGWNLWYRTGQKANAMFENTVDIVENALNVWHCDDERDYFESVREYVADGGLDTMDDVVNYINDCAVIHEKIQTLDDDQVLVEYQDCEYEIIDKYVMSYHYDTWTYAIGIIKGSF